MAKMSFVFFVLYLYYIATLTVIVQATKKYVCEGSWIKKLWSSKKHLLLCINNPSSLLRVINNLFNFLAPFPSTCTLFLSKPVEPLTTWRTTFWPCLDFYLKVKLLVQAYNKWGANNKYEPSLFALVNICYTSNMMCYEIILQFVWKIFLRFLFA